MESSAEQSTSIYDEQPDNPALSDVVERNIRTIMRLRAQSARNRSFQERLSDAITEFSGRLSFLYVYALWFGAWIVINTGWLRIPVFDPFPYGLLTMIVSLEAIFLATFVLISQNRLSEEADRRSDLDLHIGLLSEVELTTVLKMLHVIQIKLGIESENPTELRDLELRTNAEDVLAEMDKLKLRAKQTGKSPF